MKIRGLSLFANCGIGEYYINDGDNRVVIANEMCPERASLYSIIHPDTTMIVGDITDKSIYNIIVKRSLEEKVNLVMATPPCQAMSILSKVGRQSKLSNEFDKRNSLIIPAINAIIDIQPDYAIIENVCQMKDTSIIYNNSEINIIRYIIQKLRNEYNIAFHLLDAADFGTPQHRRRLIVLISRKPNNWFVPYKILPRKTVWGAISHLPSIEANIRSDIPWHFTNGINERHIHWMANTPSGSTAFDNSEPDHVPFVYDSEANQYRTIRAFKTSYKRIQWDKPAPTITSCSGLISSQNNVHPGRRNGNHWSDARPLTIREISILTGLPENWLDLVTEDDFTEEFVRKVIGEAVAPKLVKALVYNIGKEDEITKLYMESWPIC